MAQFYTNQSPEWEVVNYGWHAAVTKGSSNAQWTAFVEVDGQNPLWRIWAGCMFHSVEEAQEWCHSEIMRQRDRSIAFLQSERVEGGQWLWGNVEPMHNNEFMAC